MTDVWNKLAEHQKSAAKITLAQMFASDPRRFEKFSGSACGILVDYSKTHVADETIRLFKELLDERDFSGWRQKMFSGGIVNPTEKRPALHIALRNRSNTPVMVDSRDVMPEVNAVLSQMRRFVDKIRSEKKIKNIVNIGIGGSSLGPEMVAKALAHYALPGLRTHFVSNVDGTHLHETLQGLKPAETLFIVASKTFTTPETMLNAQTAKEWITQSRLGVADHFVALSTNETAVTEFGILPGNIFRFWDWVGGRYSVWSAIGLSVALLVGMDRFEEFLSGAHDMDQHFLTAPVEQNLPVLLALVGVWYRNFWNAPAYAVIPYDQYLRRFPAWLQQLDMESNGKSVTRDGKPVAYATGPLMFGEPGTDAQHSFFQLFHQGTDIVPLDFIACKKPLNPAGLHHTRLLANFIAQMEALMKGLDHAEPHKAFKGNRPTIAILLDELTPRTLGSLLALYEHKIFTQGVLWQINSFDQFGVELGKVMTRKIEEELIQGKPGEHDASTRGLMRRILQGT